MKINILPGKIYRSSTDIKFSPIFVTKIEPSRITYYYMRDPDRLLTTNINEAIMFWSDFQ